MIILSFDVLFLFLIQIKMMMSRRYDYKKYHLKSNRTYKSVFDEEVFSQKIIHLSHVIYMLSYLVL